MASGSPTLQSSIEWLMPYGATALFAAGGRGQPGGRTFPATGEAARFTVHLPVDVAHRGFPWGA
jgi:hypothetical protein